VRTEHVIGKNENVISVRFTSTTTLFAWLVCGLGALYYCYEYFLRIAPSVMTQELMQTYHLNGVEIGSLSAFYYHAYVPMQILVGLLMDRYGPRRLLSVACLLCAIGTYLFASGTSLPVAQLGRFLVGLGSAFAFVGAAKLATIWLPPNRFALVSGIIMTLGMLGAIVGDISLRLLVDAIGWRTTLFGSAFAGIVLAVILWVVIRDVSPTNPHADSHETVSFGHVLRGLKQAVLSPQVWLIGLVGFLLYLSLSAFAELWAVPYLEQAHGFTRMQAATATSVIFLGWAVGSPFWGWFSDYLQLRRLPMILSAVGALIVTVILLYVPGLSPTLIYALLFLSGVLCGVQILVFAMAREATSLKIAGTTIGLINMLVMVGGNVFQPVVGKLLDMHWTNTLVNGTRIYSADAYMHALSVLPLGIIAAIVILLFIKETRCQVREG